MIEIIRFEEPNVIGFRVDGKIDDDSFKKAMESINAALGHAQKLSVYAEVKSLGGMSIETFFENLKFKFQILGELDRFDKEAVVTDKRWLETVTKVVDKLFPSIEVRCYPFDDRDKALAWIKGRVPQEN